MAGTDTDLASSDHAVTQPGQDDALIGQRATCRISKIAAARGPLYAGTLARLGATKAEQAGAIELLQDRAVDVCEALAQQDSAAHAELAQLIGEVEARFVSEQAPGLKGIGSVFLEGLADDLDQFEGNCFDGVEVDPETLTGLTDEEFDAALSELAWGTCGDSEGAGVGTAAWSDDARTSFASCVREGMLDGINSANETCNIAGTDNENADPAPEPTPDDDPNTTPDDPATDDPEPPADQPTPPASGPTADQAAAAAEILLGVAGIGVGIGVLVVSFQLAMPTEGGSLGAGIPTAIWLIRQGFSHLSDGWGRLFHLCPNLDTNAGHMGYAGDGGTETPERGFSLADALHSCRCATAATHPDTDPTGSFGSSCDNDRQTRLDCLRDPYDATGRMRTECARMLAEDNATSLASRASACATALCGADMVMSETCSCVTLGAPGTGGDVPGTPFDPCETISCPPDSVPIADGSACSCSDPDIGTPGPGL